MERRALPRTLSVDLLVYVHYPIKQATRLGSGNVRPVSMRAVEATLRGSPLRRSVRLDPVA
jgi:hypothetical protein